MGAIWQQITVFVALGLALMYIVIHIWRQRKAEPGCKSCPALKALSKKNKASKTAASV